MTDITLIPETDKLAIAGDIGTRYGINAEDVLSIIETFEDEINHRIKERQRASLGKCKIITCTNARADLSQYCQTHAKSAGLPKRA